MESLSVGEGRGACASTNLTVGFAAVALSLFALCYGLLGPSLSLLGSAFGISLPQQGALMTVQSLGYLLAVIFGGYVSDRWGKNKTSTTGLAVMGCGMLLVGTSRSYAWALLGMGVMGSGGGLIEMTASAAISDLLPDRRGSALNLLQLVFGLSAVGPLLITWQMESAGAWRSVFVALGVGSLILMPVASMVKWHAGSARDRIDLHALLVLVGRPRLWAVASSQALYVFSEVGLTSWAVTYLASARAATTAQANGALSLFWVAMSLGRLVCSTLSNRMTLDRLIIGLSVGAALSLVIVLVLPVGAWAWRLIGIAGLFYSGIFATTLAYAGNTYPRHSGTVFGLIMAAGAAGSLVGPWMMGSVAEATTINLAFGLVVLSMLGTTLIYARLGASVPDPLLQRNLGDA